MVRIARAKPKAAAARYLPYALLSFALVAQACFMLLVHSGAPAKLDLLRTGIAGFGAGHLAAASAGDGGQLRGARYRTRNLQEAAAEKEVAPEQPPPPEEKVEISASETKVTTEEEAAPEQQQQQSPEEAKKEPVPEGWGGAANEVWPKPKGWEGYSFYRIRKHFECKQYANDHTKPLPTDEDWAVFKKTYQEVVEPNETFDDPVPGSLGYTFGEGGPPPFHARHGERGRGLFASRDIKKGELIHDGTQAEVIFPSGMSWRKYIFALPRNKACDMIDWTWTQEHESDGKVHILTAINIEVLWNGGNRETMNTSPESDHSMKEYALRDIAKGEELLTDYQAVVTDWEPVGLY